MAIDATSHKIVATSAGDDRKYNDGVCAYELRGVDERGRMRMHETCANKAGSLAARTGGNRDTAEHRVAAEVKHRNARVMHEPPMPNYSKLHDLISHRVTIEYDTGARVTGYLASCQPSTGPVEFVVLQDAKLVDSRGRVVREAGEMTMCPNVLTAIALDEGPRGRDLK